MSDLTPEALDELERLHREATPGPWTATKPPGGYSGGGWPSGLIVAAVSRGMGIYADPPSGSYPAADRRLIPAARNALPALIAAARERDRIVARIHRLRDGVDIPGDQVKDYLLGNDEEG